MISNKINSFFESFFAIWEKGLVQSLAKYYHPEYIGIYHEEKISCDDAMNRLLYIRHHYSDLCCSILSISQSGNNKYLVMTNGSALYGEKKEFTEMLSSTLYELKDQLIYRTWTVTNKPFKMSLQLNEKEDFSTKSAQKAKLLSQISVYLNKQSLDLTLSPKEMDSLYYYLLGNPLKVIAAELNVQTSTIETHLRRVVNKFGLKTKLSLRQLFNIT